MSSQLLKKAEHCLDFNELMQRAYNLFNPRMC